MRLSELKKQIRDKNLENQAARVNRIHSSLYKYTPMQGLPTYFQSKSDALHYILNDDFYYDFSEDFQIIGYTHDFMRGSVPVHTRI